ncbi:MAG: IS110 family transposase [Alphaproteobacteria bacterium]|nr:IS110 family transposase [Alphaproteobacteria bacterium]
MNRIVVGIDISKGKFDAAYMATDHKWQKRVFENSLAGFKVFLSWLKEKNVESCHTVMEATGRYGEDLANFLFMAGHKVSIVNPAQIKYYSRSLLRRTKTDKVDSQLIAEFSQRHALSDWQPLSPSLQSLKDQVRCLEAFKKDATQASNRLEHAKDDIVKKILEEHLNHIQNQIDRLILMIRKLARNDPVLFRKIELLMSIPGIAETTALKLLGELPDLSTFKCAKQLAAYAGLNPSIKTSGTSVKGKNKISKTGSRELRKMLFFPAMTLMRHPSPLAPFIERMRIKGKKGKVIVVAVMRKILHIVFGVIKTQRMFQGAV